jgi:hypothetical protein
LALAHVVFTSELVTLAAALETASAAQNGLTRAASELRQLAEEAVEHSGPPGDRI